ncbi:MAG: 30S ribosomal protein S15 [Firmicutes bacterium]|nr:30S ribosomal protein S15 [Bacillota bacterium]
MQEKKTVITKFGKNEQDTGSAEVQIALLTERIKHLTEHVKAHPHDNHTRRGLLKLVSQRKRMLKYLENTDIERFRKIKASLELR